MVAVQNRLILRCHSVQRRKILRLCVAEMTKITTVGLGYAPALCYQKK